MFRLGYSSSWELMTHALIYSLIICAVGVALEGLFAGGGIKQRLAELRLPRYAVPFWGWVIIGVLYYVICFALLYRLFRLPPSLLRSAALALIGAMMFINALWNYFFFRTRNLFHAFLLGLPYSLIAFALLAVFLRIDPPAAVWLSPYLLYLFYATVWGYRTWKLNPSS
jgi:tryptophan-rich sensory protein